MGQELMCQDVAFAQMAMPTLAWICSWLKQRVSQCPLVAQSSEEMLTDELTLLLKLELALQKGLHGITQESQEQSQSKPLLRSRLLDFSVCVKG